jgi:hypothetical protein
VLQDREGHRASAPVPTAPGLSGPDGQAAAGNTPKDMGRSLGAGEGLEGNEKAQQESGKVPQEAGKAQADAEVKKAAQRK